MPKKLDPPPLTAFGGRLAHWRKLRGYSQGAFAEKLGIKQGSLSELETGKSKSPSADVLVNACDLLQIRPRYLWLGEEPAELQNFSELSGTEAQLVMMFRSLPTDAARQAFMIDMNAKQSQRTQPATVRTTLGGSSSSSGRGDATGTHGR